MMGVREPVSWKQSQARHYRSSRNTGALRKAGEREIYKWSGFEDV